MPVELEAPVAPAPPVPPRERAPPSRSRRVTAAELPQAQRESGSRSSARESPSAIVVAAETDMAMTARPERPTTTLPVLPPPPQTAPPARPSSQGSQEPTPPPSAQASESESETELDSDGEPVDKPGDGDGDDGDTDVFGVAITVRQADNLQPAEIDDDIDMGMNPMVSAPEQQHATAKRISLSLRIC